MPIDLKMVKEAAEFYAQNKRIPIPESLIVPVRLSAKMHIEFDADDPQQVAAAKGMAALHQAAPEMYALLKEVEWSQGVGRGMDDAIVSCPSCKSTEDIGHQEDCRLAAVLKAVEGE